MSLLVYNLTAAPLVLANGLSTTIPASTAGAGVRGEPWYASGNEIQGRSVPEYIALQAQQDSGVVQFEWEASPEYDTYPLVVGSPPLDVSENDIAIYVALSGNDANPGTAALPLATISAALRKVPAAWNKSCTIFLNEPGLYSEGFIPLNPGINVGPASTPLAIVGLYADVVAESTVTDISTASGAGTTIAGAAPNMQLTAAVPSFSATDVGQFITIKGAATPSNNGTFPITAFVDASNVVYTNPYGVAEAFAGTFEFVTGSTFNCGTLAETPDAHYGAFITCTSSANGNAGFQGMVRMNTATGFNLNQAFPNPVVAGDKFTVQRPSTVTNAFFQYAGSGREMVGFKAISFDGNGIQAFTACNLTFEGCEIKNAFFVFLGNRILFADDNHARPWDGATNSPFSDNRNRAGAFLQNIGFGGFFLSQLTGTVVMQNAFIVAGNGDVNFTCPEIQNLTYLQGNRSQANFTDGSDFGGPQYPWRSDGGSFGPGSAVFESDQGSHMAFRNGRVTNSSGSVAKYTSNSMGEIIGLTDGGGNAEYGIVVTGMSQALIPALPSSLQTNVSGALGDTRIGAVVKTYGAISPDGFSEVNGGGPTLNRIAPDNI